MATIRPGRASRRPGTSSRQLIYYTRNGRLHVRAWPRKRGRPKQPWQRANLDKLRYAQQLVKRMTELETQATREALDSYMQSNQGLRGTAAIRLRDWLMMQLTGRQWIWEAEDGARFYPAAVVQDISDMLDHAEPRPGSLLTRTDAEWLPTVQCRPGAVFQVMPDGGLPDACPAATLPAKHETVGGY